jgi:hypothetical protein
VAISWLLLYNVLFVEQKTHSPILIPRVQGQNSGLLYDLCWGLREAAKIFISNKDTHYIANALMRANR